MTQTEREAMVVKIEELQHRVGALSSAAKLIEGELEALQFAFWKQTATSKEEKYV